MRKLNNTLIAFAISATLLCACSKDDSASRIKDIESVAVNHNRFVIYNTIDTPEQVSVMSVTRAGESKPDAPTIPAGAVNMMDVDGNGNKYTAWSAQKGVSYYLPEGAEWSDQMQLGSDFSYYIEGELTLNCYGKGELNILPKGTLKMNGQSINNCSVKCWGEVDVDPNSDFVIGFGSSFFCYSDSVITAAKMQNQGEFVHYGDIKLSSILECSGYKSSFTLYGNVEAIDLKAYNSSKAYVSGNVVTDEGVDVTGSSSLKIGASLVAPNGRVYSTNNSSLDVADYIKCETLYLDSNGSVITHNETLIECDNLIYKNNTAKIHNADDEGVYTVIVVKNLEEAWNSIDRMNGGGIDLNTDPKEFENLDWTANVIFNGSTYIPEKGLRPEFGTRPVDPEPVYTLDHIGSIASLDKESVSATSIDFIKNTAYFSWHKRGDKYDGYIDVANIDSRTILSTLHAATRDFNNISVVDDLIIAVGADAKGAVISNINYFGSAVTSDYSYVEGASANSVLSVGESTWVTTNIGIAILTENKFISLDNAKYAVAANDKVVVLAASSEASLDCDLAMSLYIFEQTGDLVKEFSCGAISVKNGKNTIFADDNKIYVSLGVQGLRSYDFEGNLLNEFAGFKSADEGAVNGVSVDENYIYMACGLSGLYILDKTDFSLIKSYKLNGASANFVKKASDGLIYVAYGLNGVHVLELREQK